MYICYFSILISRDTAFVVSRYFVLQKPRCVERGGFFGYMFQNRHSRRSGKLIRLGISGITIHPWEWARLSYLIDAGKLLSE